VLRSDKLTKLTGLTLKSNYAESCKIPVGAVYGLFRVEFHFLELWWRNLSNFYRKLHYETAIPFGAELFLDLPKGNDAVSTLIHFNSIRSCSVSGAWISHSLQKQLLPDNIKLHPLDTVETVVPKHSLCVSP